MSREILNHTCEYCESSFKLSYDDNDISSLPKFCPFCGEETFTSKDEDMELELDDDQSLG